MSRKSRNRSFSDRFWNDKQGRFTVWQKPNWLLITWFVAFVLSVILPEDTVGNFISLLGGIAIFVWACLELIWGVNIFRKTVGLCVLLLFAASYLL